MKQPDVDGKLQIAIWYSTKVSGRPLGETCQRAKAILPQQVSHRASRRVISTNSNLTDVQDSIANCSLTISFRLALFF